MKPQWRTIGLHIFLLSCLALAAQPAQAQQNLFNVPSGQITEAGELFFQEQVNLTRPLGTSNSTFDFGLGGGWEVGFNVLDLTFYENPLPTAATERRQTNPDLLLNVQKGFDIIEDFWQLGIGTQLGFNPARRSRNVRLQNFTWAVNEFELPEEWGKIYAGGYFANVAYAGPGPEFGGLFGVEIPIIKDTLHFQADLITGRRDISVAVVGGVYIFPNKWQLSFGVQLPLPHSGNAYGGVLEFTIPGYPLFSRRE